MDGRTRQTHFVGGASLENAQNMQEAHHKGGGGAQAAAGRKITGMVDLETLGQIGVAKCLANSGVLDFVDFFDHLGSGVHNSRVVLEKGREFSTRQVRVLIDAGGKHHSHFLVIPGRIVGSTAKKRNSKRSSTDNHCSSRNCSALWYDAGVPMSMKRQEPQQAKRSLPTRFGKTSLSQETACSGGIVRMA